MKQYKCSMSKKKEAVSRGSRDLLDNDELTQKVQGIYENELNKLIDGADEKEKPYYQSVDYVLEDYIPDTVETIQKDMYKYVLGGEYAMPNNWRQINLDWDRDHKDGIKFSALREKLLDGVNDADTEEFSQWGIDWFFKAFGTFGLRYNFREAVTDIVYNDMAEDGVFDESKKSEATKFIDSKIDALVKEISDKYGFTLQEKTRPGWETSWYLASGNTFGHMADGKIAIWINGFRPNGEFLNLGYKVGKGDASSVGKDIRTFDTLKKNLLADCDRYFGAGASESKKNERGTTQIETYEGFDELLGYADAEYLLEDVVDVLSKYYTYEDETFDEDQAKDDPEFTIKIEGGDERADFYSEDIFYVHLPNKEAAEELAKVLGGELSESKKPESKKSEGISDMIDAKIDYNMFMRMCKTAAYLEEDEDYWDALWEYYSDLGSIGDALVFFDNLFQYTSWKTAEDLWTDYSNILGDKPEGKDYEEALDAYLDENGNEVGNSAVYKYGDHYLMLH